ncbi:MAG: ATP-independent RNA helicase DbpA [Halieaceae bacterium]|jgi:ATP-independent RNA helicase DbpA
MNGFSKLSLPTEQLENLTRLGYLEMTSIQAEALPLALAGKDLIAQAKTGSGKTAAFALPLLAKLNPRDFGAQALILCPTRELATQVATEVRRLSRYQQNIKVVTLCGGQSIGPQIGSLEHGAHIVVGTPGRIKDHLRKQTLDISRVTTLVLDEADRMLEMGFMEDIAGIIEATPPTRQTLLFSATYPENIQSLSRRFQRDAISIQVESQHDSQQIQQLFYICERSEKRAALQKLLSYHTPAAAVIFCNTKEVTREITNYLCTAGSSALALHGDLDQRDRDQVLVQFRQQSCRILVATDVAARGLDIEDLPAVVNYDLPRDPEQYIHRIGRTGRAGKHGLALSLFTDSERYRLTNIADYQSRELDYEAIGKLPAGGREMPPSAFVTLCIAGGRKQKVRPGDILGALTGEDGIDGKSVGKIDINDFASFVAIDRPMAGVALEKLRNRKIKGRKFKVRKL